MKKQIIWIGCIVLAAFMTACNESTTANSKWTVALHANYINPDRTSITFVDSAGGTEQFTVNSQDTPWTISSIPDWISVNPMSGSSTSSVSVAVGEHLWASARVGVLSLSSTSPDWTFTKPITVIQSGAPAYAILDKTSLSFDGGTNQEQVSIETNCDWGYSNNNSGWINLRRNNDVLEVAVQANESLESRSGIVTILFEGSVLAEITVMQEPAKVDAKTDPLNFGNIAGTYKLAITSQADWSVYTDSYWIDLNPTSAAAGSSELTVSVSPNTEFEPRSGYVYLRFKNSGNEIAQIPVNQEGIELKLGTGEDNILFESSLEQTSTIRVESNTEWYFSMIPSWITVDPTSGTGTVDVTLSIQDNGHYWFRGYDELRVTRKDSWYGVSRYLGQNARTLELNTTYLSFLDVAQTQYVDVATEGSWELAYSSGFFSASPVSAKGNGRIAVSVDENPTNQDREGHIEFRLLGMPDYENGYDTRDITIWQPAWSERYRNVQNEVAVPAMGGTMDIWLDTNDNWQVSLSNSPSWIHFSGETSGSGSCNLQLAFDDNNSVNARGVKAVISFGHMDPVEITISQAGRTMFPNCESVFFFAKGGSNTVTVTADGAYKVEKVSGDWFSLTTGENNTFSIVASENTSGAVREGSVRLKLLGLTEGSLVITIPVVQTTKEEGFTRGVYQEDKNLNIGVGSGFSIKVISYGEDQSWSGSRSVTISGEGFDSDENWN